MLLRHLQQIILKVRISSGSKTFCKRLKKNDLSFFLKVATFDSDFISQGSAFHMYGILIKNEFLKRDVLALLMFRNCRDVPLRDRPVQKEKYWKMLGLKSNKVVFYMLISFFFLFHRSSSAQNPLFLFISFAFGSHMACFCLPSWFCLIMTEFKVCSLNVRGLGEQLKR